MKHPRKKLLEYLQRRRVSKEPLTDNQKEENT